MFVEVKTSDGEVYRFNGVDEVTQIEENDATSDPPFVRLKYVVPEGLDDDHVIYRGETGEAEFGEDNPDLSVEASEGMTKIDVKGGDIYEVRPTDVSKAY